jgi:hypothetical protein
MEHGVRMSPRDGAKPVDIRGLLLLVSACLVVGDVVDKPVDSRGAGRPVAAHD